MGLSAFLMLHYRAQPLEPELARTTLELVHWALEGAGTPIGTKQLEYIDLFSSKLYSITKRRTSTVKTAEQNLKTIQTLWPAL